MTMSSCTCEPTESAQGRGDSTHAGIRPQSAQRHGLHNVWFFCVGGSRAWSIDMCSNKDAGKGERETPTPCEPTGKQKNPHRPRHVIADC